MDRQLYAEQGTMDVRWNFFVGAAILAGGLLLKFGAPVEAIGAGIGLALYVVLALLALVLTWRTWQRTTDPRLRFGALTLCGLLVSPHVYVYDLVLLTPALAWLGDWLLDAPAESRPLRWSLALLYLWPVGGLILTYYAGINAGPVIMLATLALTGRASQGAIATGRFAGSRVRGFAGRRG